MKKISFIICALLVLGCAKLTVETTKPIKVDISMRVDIYQHVVEDVASIEDQIYGSTDKQMNFLFFMESVYAADIPAEVQEAIDRRKAHADEIEDLLSSGLVGENKDALLEDVSDNQLHKEKTLLLVIENNARNIIYNYTADKNGIDITEARKVFFSNHRKRAPAGYWFQVKDGDSYKWVQK